MFVISGNILETHHNMGDAAKQMNFQIAKHL